MRARLPKTLSCPSCGSTNDRVIDTNNKKDGTIDRCRKCVQCGARYHTIEVDRKAYAELKRKAQLFDKAVEEVKRMERVAAFEAVTGVQIGEDN